MLTNTMYRHEHKFLLQSGQYQELRHLLGKLLQQDAYSGTLGGYHVRSLYFDDINDSAFIDKASGLVHRHKYRIRVYNYSPGTIKLEIKTKVQDYISKRSSALTKLELEALLQQDYSFFLDSEDKVRQHYYHQLRNHILRPKVIVDYFREAFILPYNQIRITFDKNLAAGQPHGNLFDTQATTFQIGAEYDLIMEVKYNNFLPNHLQQLLAGYASNRLAVSKYYLCRKWQHHVLGEGIK